MDGLFYILFFVGILWLILWVINSMIRNAANTPTWNGIIISAILGILPLYLILCFFGIMGEPRSLRTTYNPQTPIGNYAEDLSRRHANNSSSRTGKWIISIVLIGFSLILLFGFLNNRSDEQESIQQIEVADPEPVIIEEAEEEKEAPTLKKDTETPKQKTKETQPPVADETSQMPAAKQKAVKINDSEPSIPNSIEAGNANQNKEVEETLSTIELLERKNHENVVKRAKEAGVSTEGSTIEILERINHKNVVKQAKEAGVSTEGSTIDILERINHANAVKQAKRMGVSTEGSTMEILDRIHRKTMEKYLE